MQNSKAMYTCEECECYLDRYAVRPVINAGYTYCTPCFVKENA